MAVALLSLLGFCNGEDPYRFYTWNITYGDISPLGVEQKVNFVFFFPQFHCFLGDPMMLKRFECAGDIDKREIPRAAD